MIIKKHFDIEDFNIEATSVGIEAEDYGNSNKKHLWEQFYNYLLEIKTTEGREQPEFVHDALLESLVRTLESRGGRFYHNNYGNVKYLELGNNTGPITNISYVRIVNHEKGQSYKRLQVLIEKGLELDQEDLSRHVGQERLCERELIENGTVWVL